MASDSLTVTLRLRRGGPQRMAEPAWQEFPMTIAGDLTVAEALEFLKGEQEPGLVFRHSCHHGSCGTCAMRINGVERLACTTALAEVVGDGGRVTVEPLSHLTWMADLANDPSPLMERLEALGPGHVRLATGSFALCIECGACLSACPVAGPSSSYEGPAALAAAHDAVLSGQTPGAGWAVMLERASGTHGVWQCHTAFECSRVCPAKLDPAGAIVNLRRLLAEGRSLQPHTADQPPAEGQPHAADQALIRDVARPPRRGRGVGYWAFYLNRASSLVLTVYLLAHLGFLSALYLGQEAYDAWTALVSSRAVVVLEILLVAAVVYHGFNGVRLSLVGLNLGARRQAVWFWVVFVCGLATLAFMAARLLAGG